MSEARPTIGWREWLALPELGLGCVQARIDTCRRRSWLYAVEVEDVEVKGEPRLRFVVLPIPQDPRVRVSAEAPRAEPPGRDVRPAIRTLVTLGHLTWTAEVVLVGHPEHGSSLTLGRDTLGDRFVVDPSRSCAAGPPALE